MKKHEYKYIYADGLNTFKQLMISPATVDRVEKKHQQPWRWRRHRKQQLARSTLTTQ
jgi:hypothetical protein